VTSTTGLRARSETPVGSLVVAEPSPEALHAASADLATFYNEPNNAALLGNTFVFTPDDVVAYWSDAREHGARAFLLWCDSALVGDADFRHFSSEAAELALLVGSRTRQGKGLGGRFVAILLAMGFGELGLGRIYVSIRPENTASIRLFTRAGFAPDDSKEASAFVDEEGDVCMSLARADYAGSHS
jgi:RimJ/RimL family protein N-acetyltransferase